MTLYVIFNNPNLHTGVSAKKSEIYRIVYIALWSWMRFLNKMRQNNCVTFFFNTDINKELHTQGINIHNYIEVNKITEKTIKKYIR